MSYFSNISLYNWEIYFVKYINFSYTTLRFYAKDRVAKRLKTDGIFNDFFVANLLLTAAVKNNYWNIRGNIYFIVRNGFQ